MKLENPLEPLLNYKTFTMKAIIYNQYGPPEVLHLQEVEKPTPANNEILIKVKATAVNSADWRLRKADPVGVRLFFGLLKPKKKILGGVFSGEVEEIGKDVKLFKVGDQVFGSAGTSFGSYAAYKCLPENGVLAKKPGNFSHNEAAVIPFGGITALHFLQKAKIEPGQEVLIYGASGSVGSAAVQLAKNFEAHVTGICSTTNIELVRSLGADVVIDYTRQDFTKTGETYDVIYDTVNKMKVSGAIKSLKKGGTLILGAAGISEMFQGLWASKVRKIKLLAGVIKEEAKDIIFLKELMVAGKFKPVIDRTYPLENISEAHAYAEKGHKKGNIAIEVNY